MRHGLWNTKIGRLLGPDLIYSHFSCFLFVCFFLMKTNFGKAEERMVWREEGLREGRVVIWSRSGKFGKQ